MRKYFCLAVLLLFVPFFTFAAPVREPDNNTATPNNNRAAPDNERRMLIAAAESFLGTPYRYAGLDRRGLDCSGLVYASFREGLNQIVPRRTEDLYNWAQKIPAGELQPGDLVFFSTARNTVSHVGIYTGNGRFIHSASEGPQTGVIYSRLDESYWSRTFLAAGRVFP